MRLASRSGAVRQGRRQCCTSMYSLRLQLGPRTLAPQVRSRPGKQDGRIVCRRADGILPIPLCLTSHAEEAGGPLRRHPKGGTPALSTACYKHHSGPIYSMRTNPWASGFAPKRPVAFSAYSRWGVASVADRKGVQSGMCPRVPVFSIKRHTGTFDGPGQSRGRVTIASDGADIGQLVCKKKASSLICIKSPSTQYAYKWLIVSFGDGTWTAG